MTRDINHLLKIAKSFDDVGLFSSSEAVDSVIKHIAKKLSNDTYRTYTKKVRDGIIKKIENKKANAGMPEKLLAIAAQFDIEGNFEEADRITKTVETMLKKKISKGSFFSDDEDFGEPGEKSPEMKSFLDSFTGETLGRTRSDSITSKKCVFCEKPIDLEKLEEIDRREFAISGICPDCFPKESEESDEWDEDWYEYLGEENK